MRNLYSEMSITRVIIHSNSPEEACSIHEFQKPRGGMESSVHHIFIVQLPRCKTPSPLMMALELGRTDIAEKLLKLGASAAFWNKVSICWNLWVGRLARERS